MGERGQTVLFPAYRLLVVICRSYLKVCTTYFIRPSDSFLPLSVTPEGQRGEHEPSPNEEDTMNVEEDDIEEEDVEVL